MIIFPFKSLEIKFSFLNKIKLSISFEDIFLLLKSNSFLFS